jgi:hypothetical protein
VGEQPSYDFASPHNGIETIVRLNYGRSPKGTIPHAAGYKEFADACADTVKSSTGCHRWLIGNEPNYRVEWPDGEVILPSDYATCYELCAKRIWAIPGHQRDEVIPAAVAPWNDNVKYDGNTLP